MDEKAYVEEIMKRKIEHERELRREAQAMAEEFRQLSAQLEREARKKAEAQQRLEQIQQAKVWCFTSQRGDFLVDEHVIFLVDEHVIWYNLSCSLAMTILNNLILQRYNNLDSYSKKLFLIL